MAQSAQLATESAAMRAFETAIERAKGLSPRAQRRVLDWADERIGEARAEAEAPAEAQRPGLSAVSP
jgi:hypothetical protein